MSETKKYFFSLLFIASLVIFFPSSGKTPPHPGPAVGGAAIFGQDLLPVPLDREVTPPEPKASIPQLSLDSAAALARDLRSGLTLYEKNSGQTHPIASLTKLMTALVAVKLSSPDDIAEIPVAPAKVPEFRAGLQPGEQLYVSDLLKAILVASANDAAMAIALHTSGSVEKFAEAMNREAGRLGMKNTSFSNPAGLDDPGNFSTARDLALLVDEFLRHPELVEIAGTQETVIASLDGQHTHRLISTNRLLGRKTGITGLKTGYTTEAKGTLIALVAEPGFYTIVLGAENREAETEKLLEWVKENFIWTP